MRFTEVEVDVQREKVDEGPSAGDDEAVCAWLQTGERVRKVFGGVDGEDLEVGLVRRVSKE